jgi:hypothetical protein
MICLAPLAPEVRGSGAGRRNRPRFSPVPDPTAVRGGYALYCLVDARYRDVSA